MSNWIQTAIDRLERSTDGHDSVIASHLREMLATPSAKQEPVAWLCECGDVAQAEIDPSVFGDHWKKTPLYAAPQSVMSDDSNVRVSELEDALKLALEFIDDATITDGQWHWVEEARAAIKAQSGKVK